MSISPRNAPDNLEFAVSTALAQNSAMNTAAELPSASAEHALMRFEQPLTERMRTFLRVEFLYEQTLFHVDEPTEFSARAAVTALLEILTILGRSDVRTDVSKELERHADILGRYRSQPGVGRAAAVLDRRSVGRAYRPVQRPARLTRRASDC